MPPISLNGIVSKVGFMNKTATVIVSKLWTHPRTGKKLERGKKFLVHDPDNKLQLEDSVVIRNCPPVSARKRFVLEKIIKSPADERAVERERVKQAERLRELQLQQNVHDAAQQPSHSS